MKKLILIFIGIFIFLVIVWGFSVYNTMVKKNEKVREAWSQVENQYQRRLDLIPNLVNTVKGYMEYEKEVLEEVTKARASVGQIKVGQEVIENPELFSKFVQAQDSLSGALSRLLAVVEKYPDLKANQNFIALQTQLEGTENRIAVERRRFNEAVMDFNAYIKRIPNNIIASFGNFKEKEYFKAVSGAERPPEVKF
jgi:LemA protein